MAQTMTRPRPAPSMLEKAVALRATLAAAGAENEAAYGLSATTLAALHAGGFFSLFVPAALGGAEVMPGEALEVIEALCNADASTGWVVMATQLATGAAGAYLPDPTIETLFRPHHPIIAGQGAPNGRAEVVAGGYRLTGRWSYGSGLKHADHIHTGAIVHENGVPRMLPGTQSPERRIFIVPKSRAVLGDNWDVIGLRATGSIDYALDNVFVPDDWTHDPAATASVRGGAFYRIGQLGMGTMGHTGFALGVTRRVLDELRAIAAEKRDPVRQRELPGGLCARGRQAPRPRAPSSRRPGAISSARSRAAILWDSGRSRWRGSRC